MRGSEAGNEISHPYSQATDKESQLAMTSVFNTSKPILVKHLLQKIPHRYAQRLVLRVSLDFVKLTVNT